MVKLGEVADSEKFSIRMGPFGSQLKKHELVNEGIKVLWIENIVDNEFKWLDNKCITEDKFKQLEGFEVKPNDILTTTMGTIGRTCVVPPNIGKAIISSHLLKISPDLSLINPTFVAKYMSSGSALRYFDKKAHGIVMKGLNTSIIKNMPMPLPPLPTQHKIVEILEEADNLRKLRWQVNEKMKDLIPALFVQMFGDPAVNPKGWDIKKLRDVVNDDSDIVGGPFGSNLKVSDYKEEGVPIIRLQNIDSGKFIEKDIKYITQDKAKELSYHSYQPGDLILAKLGDPIGKTCLVPEAMQSGIVVSDVVRIRVSPLKTNVKFILYALNSEHCLSQLNKDVFGTTRPRVNLAEIRNLKIPLPPLPLQQEFAKLVEDIETEKARQAESKKKLDELFQSLMQRAFTGELAA